MVHAAYWTRIGHIRLDSFAVHLAHGATSWSDDIPSTLCTCTMRFNPGDPSRSIDTSGMFDRRPNLQPRFWQPSLLQTWDGYGRCRKDHGTRRLGLTQARRASGQWKPGSHFSTGVVTGHAESSIRDFEHGYSGTLWSAVACAWLIGARATEASSSTLAWRSDLLLLGGPQPEGKYFWEGWPVKTIWVGTS